MRARGVTYELTGTLLKVKSCAVSALCATLPGVLDTCTTALLLVLADLTVTLSSSTAEKATLPM